MTAKQKANELIEEFFNINDKDFENKGCNPYIDRNYAKQCALLCTDKILKSIEKDSYAEYFWQKVKTELK